MILGSHSDIKGSYFLDGYKNEKFQQIVLLGVAIGNKLSFKTHTENIYQTGKYKLHALQHIRWYSLSIKPKVFLALTTVVYNYVLETCYAKVKEIENNNKQEKNVKKTYLFVLTK